MNKRKGNVLLGLTGKEDFAATDGLPGSRPRSLHVWPFLREEQVVLGLVDEVPARVVGLDEHVGPDRAHEELGREQGQSDVLENLKEKNTIFLQIGKPDDDRNSDEACLPLAGAASAPRWNV